jgi:aspartyl-tRNA(Asn)/glutamyl-tRNA(Gln) amidotransferase subunit B
VLCSHPRIAAFYEETILLGGDAKQTANFIQNEVMRDVATDGLAATIPVSARQIYELMSLVNSRTISGKQAKQVYESLKGAEQKSAASIVDALGLRVITDTATLEATAQKIVADNEKQAASYRAGKTALLGFFVGQMMKATKGAADPRLANELLLAALGPVEEKKS